MRTRIALFKIWIIASVLTGTGCATALAQTIAWQLQPTDYSRISRFGPGLYEVEQDGRHGLILPDGSLVVPVQADEIGRFYEGLALVTIKEKKGTRVLGVLSENGTYTPFNESYYTLYGQEFFSDGVLSVQDSKGRKGYVNPDGVRECLFDANYYLITPFTEGYATVCERNGGSYYLIDKRGQRKSTPLPSGRVGKVRFVFNPYKGKVFLMDDYTNCYRYTLATDESEELGKISISDSTDYLYRPKEEILKQGDKFCYDPPFKRLPGGTTGLSPTMEGTFYGFNSGNKTLLPCQFTAATPFEDGLSVVTFQGKTGILRLYEDQAPFSLTTPQTQYEFNLGETVSCQFQLNIPPAWQGHQIDVQLSEAKDGKNVIPEGTPSDYKIILQPTHSCQQAYAVNVSSGGLKLWAGDLTYSLKRKVVNLQISGLALEGDITDRDQRVKGSFVIYNPNEMEIETTISFTYSNGLVGVGGYPSSISLKPEERQTVSFYITTDRKFRGMAREHTLTVTSSRGGTASLTKEVTTF